jgi:hypothetical protein
VSHKPGPSTVMSLPRAVTRSRLVGVDCRTIPILQGPVAATRFPSTATSSLEDTRIPVPDRAKQRLLAMIARSTGAFHLADDQDRLGLGILVDEHVPGDQHRVAASLDMEGDPVACSRARRDQHHVVLDGQLVHVGAEELPAEQNIVGEVDPAGPVGATEAGDRDGDRGRVVDHDVGLDDDVGR